MQVTGLHIFVLAVSKQSLARPSFFRLLVSLGTALMSFFRGRSAAFCSDVANIRRRQLRVAPSAPPSGAILLRLRESELFKN